MAAKKLKIVTPAGTALWPRLNSPSTKFDDRGVYEVNLVLSDEDSEELRDKLDEFAESGKEEAVAKETKPAKRKALAAYNYHAPYKPEEDEDGNETGNYIFKFKTYATDRDGKKKKAPGLFDAKRRPVSEVVGTGSTIKVSASPSFYAMASSKTYGVSLYLNAAQILELVEPSGGGRGDFEDEDGFESDGDFETAARGVESDESSSDF